MSKNIIFYFTGTGNSLWVAREIAAVLDDAEIATISDHFCADLSRYERIGFVYPVYFGGVPLIVKSFIESLDIPGNSYLFAIATCGGSARNGVAEMNVLLSARGRNLDFGALLNMGGNYILMYGKPDKANIANEQAANELPGIASAIRIKAKHPIGKSNPFMSLVTRLFWGRVNKAALKYKVGSDCSSCGLCAKICPVCNVEIQNGKPVFGIKCEQCMACIQWCPQKTINNSEKMKARERYHHPSVTVTDLWRD